MQRKTCACGDVVGYGKSWYFLNIRWGQGLECTTNFSDRAAVHFANGLSRQ